MQRAKIMLPERDILLGMFEYQDGKLIWKISGWGHRPGDVAGHFSGAGRWSVMLFGKSTLVYRIIWAMFHGPRLLNSTDKVIDHIDGNPMNNRIENLRLVTHSQNLQNRTRNTNKKSGLLGVSKCGRNRFRAVITAGGVSHYIGSFGSPEEAHNAYLAAKGGLHIKTILEFVPAPAPKPKPERYVSDREIADIREMIMRT